jgi:hypothetical protein
MIGRRTPLLFHLRPIVAGDNEFGGVGPFVAARTPLPVDSVSIIGVSRDAAGAPLGGCTCTLFKVTETSGLPVFTQYASMVSDGSGNFSFVVGFDGPYRVTWDLDGTPVRAGISLKTLSGA